jgi:peptidoglycan/xylan/chitin deacetylase (PgdA/CDA1 family)
MAKHYKKKFLLQNILLVLLSLTICVGIGVIKYKDRNEEANNKLISQKREEEQLALFEKEEISRIEEEKIRLQEKEKLIEEAKRIDIERKIAEQKKLEEEKLKKEEEDKVGIQEKQLKKENAERVAQATVVKGTSKSIPILMYHSIEYEKDNGLRIPKEKFRNQMQYLKDNKFTPISLDELYDAMVANKHLPQKPIVITFDDGYVDNYINAYPVLKEFNFKATIFMVSGCINSPSYLNDNQLKELEENNIAIESHSVNHFRMNELNYEEQKSEIVTSKKVLEKLLKKEIKYFAYPYGRFSDSTEKLLEEAGYILAVTTVEGSANKSDGIYKLNRFYISNNHSMEHYKNVVNQ